MSCEDGGEMEVRKLKDKNHKYRKERDMARADEQRLRDALATLKVKGDSKHPPSSSKSPAYVEGWGKGRSRRNSVSSMAPGWPEGVVSHQYPTKEDISYSHVPHATASSQYPGLLNPTHFMVPEGQPF